jgi:TM2 domain-containing membrane protein YozV
MTTPVMLPQMTQEQQATFNIYYPSTQRDELVGVLLAVLLGSFGAHHFYLRRNGLGVLYLVLFWTGIPAILGIIEAFFMPERVRRFNAEQAALLAYSVVQGVTLPPPPIKMVGCPACGMVQAAGVRYRVQCGRGMMGPQ